MLPLAVVAAAALYLLFLVGGFYLGPGRIRRHHLEGASFVFLAAVLAAILVKPGGRGEPASTPLRERSWPAALAFVAAAFLLYRPALTLGLFADDYVLLEAVRTGRWLLWAEFLRPVPLLLWRGLTLLPFDTSVSFHSANVALHGANAYAVSVLAQRLGLPRAAGWTAGALFLTFPAAVEPVVWPSGVQDVLMTSLLLVFLNVVRAAALDPRVAVTGLAALAAALLTKETAAAAPLLAIALLTSRAAARRAWIVVAAAAAVVVSYVLVRSAVFDLPAGYLVPLTRYRLKEVLVRPFATLIVPFTEAEAAAHPFVPLLSVLAVAILVCAAAVRFVRSDPRFLNAAGMGIFVLFSVAPVYSYLFVGPDLHGSRYVYLGAAGWAILAAQLLDALFQQRVQARNVVALAAVLAWAFTTRGHIGAWRGASIQRDVMLEQAARIVGERGCGSVVASGLPSTLGGAVLFVNGFPEALRLRRGANAPRAVGGADTADCRLTWTGATFVVAEGPGR